MQPILSRTKSYVYLSLMLFCTMMARTDAALIEYTNGHADIGLAFETPGGLHLHYHFGVGAVLDGVPVNGATDPDGIELDPNEAYVRVPDSVRTTVTSPVPFLGLSTGEMVWTLPQSSLSGVPFVGWATEELLPSQFTSAGFRLTGWRGPSGSNFAMFQIPAFSPPAVFMQTVDGVNPANDFFPLGIGAHDHANLGFTMPGIYEIDIEGFASGPGGSFTDSGTFIFAVGDLTVVPEPASMALAVLGIAILARRRR